MAAYDHSGPTIPETDLKTGGLDDAGRRVRRRKERIVVTRKGKPAYALVPLDDLRALEGDIPLDDEPEAELDQKLARKARAESQAQGERPLSLKQLKRSLGL